MFGFTFEKSTFGIMTFAEWMKEFKNYLPVMQLTIPQETHFWHQGDIQLAGMISNFNN